VRRPQPRSKLLAGSSSTDAGDYVASLAAFEEARSIRQDLGDSAGELRALVGVCQLLVALDEVERAETLSQDLLARGKDDIRTKHFAIHFLADCSLIRGDCPEAEKRYRESPRRARPRRRHRDEPRSAGRCDGEGRAG
jgi:hypothetical protein